MIMGILSVLPHANTRRLRALVITSAKRSAIVRGPPTVAESYSGFERRTGDALFAPSGTPKAAVTRIHTTQ